MGHWEGARWETGLGSDAPRRERRSGSYRTYLPDPLAGAPIALPPAVDEAVARAERATRTLRGPTADLAGISRLLLRSEAMASSLIEGIAPSARQVALAELGQTEEVDGISAQAQLVANNMTVVREATTRLVAVDKVNVEHIVQLHRSLLPDEPRHHGLRDVQNWIGGSDWHPLDADYVPPAPQRVAPLMADLTAYLAGGLHSPLVQAALVHAQFETIHPFTDGNGRVGRALIHTVLARRGLVQDAVLPISPVLSTLRDRYIESLTRFRYDGRADQSASAALAGWISTFAEATLLACQQAEQIAAELVEVRQQWEQQLSQHRAARGNTRALRGTSAVAAILADLPGTPVLTAATVQRIHRVSPQAATNALGELHEAGILHRKAISRGRHAYTADDVLDLITWAERRLASTKFDTRSSPTVRPVPARPQS